MRYHPMVSGMAKKIHYIIPTLSCPSAAFRVCPHLSSVVSGYCRREDCIRSCNGLVGHL